jgi:hypothetical protein
VQRPHLRCSTSLPPYRHSLPHFLILLSSTPTFLPSFLPLPLTSFLAPPAHRKMLTVGQASALCDLFEAQYDLVRCVRPMATLLFILSSYEWSPCCCAVRACLKCVMPCRRNRIASMRIAIMTVSRPLDLHCHLPRSPQSALFSFSTRTHRAAWEVFSMQGDTRDFTDTLR